MVVPQRGDFVWLDFNPQAGREQAGHRAALVLSPKYYNLASGLCLAVPLTTRQKGYPFEVAVPPGLEARGVVLADQVRSMDWRIRRLEIIGPAPEEFVDTVASMVVALIGLGDESHD
jgi:mRNA interferase MazF